VRLNFLFENRKKIVVFYVSYSLSTIAHPPLKFKENKDNIKFTHSNSNQSVKQKRISKFDKKKGRNQFLIKFWNDFGG